MKEGISPKEFAKAIGLSESTLKRYVDKGKLEAVKTSGGHRRIRREEAIRFIRSNGYQILNPTAMGWADLDHGHDQNQKHLYELLLKGDRKGVMDQLEYHYASGMQLADLFDHIIAPSMHQMGELWNSQEDGIYLEHRATGICVEGVNRLRADLSHVEKKNYIAVGGTLEPDTYVLPSLMVSILMMEKGWTAHNLFSSSTPEIFYTAIEKSDPDVVWISVSDIDRNSIKRIRNLIQYIESKNILLWLGGRELPEDLPESSMLQVASSMKDLSEMIDNYQKP